MGACRFKAVNMPERLVCLNLPKTWEAYRAIASEYKDGVCDGPVSRELREALGDTLWIDVDPAHADPLALGQLKPFREWEMELLCREVIHALMTPEQLFQNRIDYPVVLDEKIVRPDMTKTPPIAEEIWRDYELEKDGK